MVLLGMLTWCFRLGITEVRDPAHVRAACRAGAARAPRSHCASVYSAVFPRSAKIASRLGSTPSSSSPAVPRSQDAEPGTNQGTPRATSDLPRGRVSPVALCPPARLSRVRHSRLQRRRPPAAAPAYAAPAPALPSPPTFRRCSRSRRRRLMVAHPASRVVAGAEGAQEEGAVAGHGPGPQPRRRNT